MWVLARVPRQSEGFESSTCQASTSSCLCSDCIFTLGRMWRTKCAGLLRAIRQGGALTGTAAEQSSSKVRICKVLRCPRDAIDSKSSGNKFEDVRRPRGVHV